RVQADRGRALVLGHATGVEEGDQAVVDAGADLHGDRDVACPAHRGRDQASHQARPDRDGAAASGAGDLGYGTAEVEIEVLASLADHDARRLLEVGRVRAVQLHRSRTLTGPAAGKETCQVIALEEPSRRDHLGDVETGAELATQRAEGMIR